MLQAIPLGGDHVEELTAARDEGLELLQHRIRQGTRIWVYPFGKEGDELGIKAVRLAELPGGLREVAYLTRIRDDDRERDGDQRRDERGFVSAGRFDHDERRRQSPHTVHRGGDSLALIGRRPPPALRTAGHHEIRLGDVDAHEDRGRCHRALHVTKIGLGPALRIRGHAPTQLCGLTNETPTTPTLSCGLVTVGNNELSSADGRNVESPFGA